MMALKGLIYYDKAYFDDLIDLYSRPLTQGILPEGHQIKNRLFLIPALIL